jgi:hypothetical protein
MQSQEKRRKTIKVLRSEATDAEANISRLIGDPECIGLPGLRPTAGRSQWRKGDWEQYATSLEQTLVGIAIHKTTRKGGIMHRLPKELAYHTFDFLFPVESTSISHAVAQDYLSLRIVCKMWKGALEEILYREYDDDAGETLKDNIQTGVICLKSCPTDCSLKLSALDWFGEHEEKMDWYWHLQWGNEHGEFDSELNALKVRIPRIAERTELDYLKITMYPSPETITEATIPKVNAPCVLGQLGNLVTNPVRRYARIRLLRVLMQKYEVPMYIKSELIYSYHAYVYGLPVMYVVWMEKIGHVLKLMKAMALVEECEECLRQTIMHVAPQTTSAWERVWDIRYSILVKKVQRLRMERLAMKLL